VLERILARSTEPKFSYSTELSGRLLTGKNLFVWDLDPDRLAEAERQYPTCRVFGVFRDVWSADSCIADVFAARASTDPPPNCYAVVCSPRSGSTFLCELLGAAGLGNPREHVRSAFVQLCTSGYSVTELMEWMFERGTRGGYFGTKLVSNFLYSLDARGIHFDVIGRFLKDRNFRIIHLLRDSAEQAVSSYFAHQTGVWHLRPGKRPQGQHTNTGYDFDLIDVEYRALCKANLELSLFVKQFDTVLELDYRDLDSDPRSTLVRVAEFLGAPNAAAAQIDLAQMPQKISKNEEQMRQFLLRFRRELAETGRPISRL
jgi:LPS sulfotransferase NodH